MPEFVSSLGISPSVIEYGFKPNYEEDVEYIVYNDANITKTVKITQRGDLVDYIELDEREIEIEPFKSTTFIVKLRWPEMFERPGEYNSLILAEEVESYSGGTVGGKISVAGRILVYVPYQDQFLYINKLDMQDVEIGNNASVLITLQNLGLKEIDNYQGVIDVYDSNNNKVGSQSFNGALKIQEVVDRKFEFEIGTKTGVHFAELNIDYSGKKAYKNDTFRVGDLYIDILDYPKKIYKGDINVYEFKVMSNWNLPIKDAFSQMDINYIDRKLNFKSENFDINAWEEKTIKMYIDARDLEKGTYPTTLSLHYGNRTTIEEFDLKVIDKFNMIYLYLGIPILIIILIFIYLKRKKGRKK